MHEADEALQQSYKMDITENSVDETALVIDFDVDAADEAQQAIEELFGNLEERKD